ncbi:MAG TPA: helix-turn-helix domain-containing protein, partial [Acidimicrobiia bacterium]|nr:helix-turn-helix domain-containing protein [Acidimicrobiia bacterium]
MRMSIPYELEGRVEQKRRTRDALIAATRELIARGVSATVEAAADEASISRSTAYRYFPNQRALLIAAHPETAATSLLPDDAPDDAATRLALVIDAFTRATVANEAQ